MGSNGLGSNGLGGKIRELRRELGVTQAQTASDAQLSQGYLSQIENGEVKNLSAAAMSRLAGALRVDPDVLLEAAGLPTAASRRTDYEALEMQVEPEVLEFFSRLDRAQQIEVLHSLEILQNLRPKDFSHPESIPRHLAQRAGH